MDKVIIVGGGLGGLLLGILLERAGIDYLVLERSTEAKQPLEGGGVISMTSQIQPLLQQLGLLDELRALAIPMSRVTLFDNDQTGDAASSRLQLAAVIDSAYSLERYGYYSLAISRPELYNVLIDKIPPHKLHLGKEVQEVHQVFDGKTYVATCECTDGSGYEGIIIGADGAYSTVRLGLYRQLLMDDRLPVRDRRPFQYENQGLVGMTRPLDPERFPMVKEDHSDTRVLVSQGDTPYTALPYGGQPMVQAGYDAAKLANVLYALAQQKQQQEQLKASNNNDGTLSTSKTVTGTENSHDKNGPLSLGAAFDSIESGLRAYERERRDEAEAVVESSRHFGRLLRSSRPGGNGGGWGLLSRQGWIGKWIRYVVLNYVPRFLVYRLSDGLNSDRPQASFLPKVI
ncbi:hypothetical protein BGW38_000250 [Lunasporangiospora selenospora]|uniref:FAD-binding domain-containing protein n=1 Tax=Lunasporangiospora selenospora TaxID=979761 RepID=A0A9P6FV44_9FUNG|nr:hypothetical protein BGW38_000250 [Lunasporangiospora selenospora]